MTYYVEHRAAGTLTLRFHSLPVGQLDLPHA